MLTELLTQPGLPAGLAIGATLGALLMLAVLMVFDAFESRGRARSRHHQTAVPRPLAASGWGDAPPARNARAQMRSGPR